MEPVASEHAARVQANTTSLPTLLARQPCEAAARCHILMLNGSHPAFELLSPLLGYTLPVTPLLACDGAVNSLLGEKSLLLSSPREWSNNGRREASGSRFPHGVFRAPPASIGAVSFKRVLHSTRIETLVCVISPDGPFVKGHDNPIYQACCTLARAGCRGGNDSKAILCESSRPSRRCHR